MHVDIKATNMELTDAIRDFVIEKVSRIEKYGIAVVDANVEVGITTNHHNKGNIFYAEMNLAVPGQVLRAQVTDDDLYKAITHMKDVLEGEVVKYKERNEERETGNGEMQGSDESEESNASEETI